MMELPNYSSVIDIQNLSVQLGGRQTLTNVSLAVKRGELMVLLGPNGAGKSTLIRTLAGELSYASSSRISIGGRCLSDWSSAELAGHRAVMPQKLDLQFAMTVSEVIALGRPRESRSSRVDVISAIMARLDILPFQHRLVARLSGGEQQRVQLGRVLAQLWDRPDPRILLLDECSSALDPAHQQLVFQELQTLARAGFAVIAAVHDLNLAAQYADNIALLKDGRLLAIGSPTQVLSAASLSEAYGLTARVERLPEGYPLVIPFSMRATLQSCAASGGGT